jgi:hypothetical protein
MTRTELVKFLEETYEPDEQLLWQTISYDDVENGIEEATPELWGRFLEYLDAHNWVAEEFSENSFQGFYNFVEENTK